MLINWCHQSWNKWIITVYGPKSIPKNPISYLISEQTIIGRAKLSISSSGPWLKKCTVDLFFKIKSINFLFQGLHKNNVLEHRYKTRVHLLTHRALLCGVDNLSILVHKLFNQYCISSPSVCVKQDALAGRALPVCAIKCLLILKLDIEAQIKFAVYPKLRVWNKCSEGSPGNNGRHGQ